MARWEHAIALDPQGDAPIFLQIARAIGDDVRRGRLKPGDALPGSRTLATSLGVHRNTVLAAYRELAAEGWIVTLPAGGTFVSRELPDATPRKFAPALPSRGEVPSRLGFDLAPFDPALKNEPKTHARGTLVMAWGTPDLRLVPTSPLARAYRRALRVHGPQVLNYGDARGHVRLREALSGMLSHLRGVAVSAETIVVTRGSQMAVDLLARALIAPGDVVAVEALGYRPAWGAMKLAGARIVPIPIDASGLRVDALAELAARETVRAVYVTPHHQYPTTVVMAPGRRLELLELARKMRIAIIEDDYDYEFHYEGRPVLPLASVDRAGVVAYIGTLSKILAPGLRLGFLVAPPPLVERVAALRTLVDRQGDQVVECAVAELIEDAEVQRHARRVRRVYHARRDVLYEALQKQLGGAVTAQLPVGGIALWAKVAPEIDVEAWLERAIEEKVAFTPGRYFAYDGRARPYVRLGYASLDEKELVEAVRRLAVAMKRRSRVAS